MAAPSYTTDLVTFTNGSSLTGFVEFTGYTDGSKQVIDPDLAIYGTSCISASNRNAAPCSLGFDLGEPAGWTSGDSFFVWQKFFAPNAVDLFANKGIVVLIGNTSANFYEFKEDGSDTYPYGGWVNYAVNPSITTNRTTVGTPSGVWGVCGMGWSMINGIAKGNALTVDIIRWGRGESIFTDGDIGNGYATFDGYALVNDNPTTGRFGLIQDVGSGYLWKGLMSLGTAATPVDFRDNNVNISIDDTLNVAADFNRIEVNHASSNIEWTGVNITKVGTVSKGEFEMIDNATVAFTGCTFTDMSTFIFLSNASVLTTTFRRCGQITPTGADMTGSVIDSYEGTADTGALIYNEAGDPDGEFDNMSFTKGIASTHAIEFGLSSPLTMTLRGIDFSGYNAANTNTDSTFYIARTTGTVTINIIGGSGNVTYKSLGALVNVVQNPVTAKITVVDVSTGLPIENARVIMAASDGTGDLGFEDSVTITRVTTTATVAHTAHPYIVGNKINIVGAGQMEYNGVQTITAVATNTYDFTVTGTPVSPATGTITSTGLTLEGLTDVNGEISDTRSYSIVQPIEGHARKSTSSPYYKTGPFSDDISTTLGYAQTVSLILDE